MEHGKKKIIMIIVFVVCLVAAGIITYKSQQNSRDISSIDAEAKIWMSCRNPDCQDKWEMNRREYFDYLLEKRPEYGIIIPPVTCPKCGEESGYRAIQCPNCKAVYEENSVPNDLPDRCPECKYSEIEERRKARLKR